jgi:threonine/homoserine/homoserine lactone efflux protein
VIQKEDLLATTEIVSPAAGGLGLGLGLGVALASAPGPVQAVLLAEAIRGGIPRGLRALAGVHVTFGLLLVCLALGLSVAAPSGPGLRILKGVGGAFLLWLAVEGFRSGHEVAPASTERRPLPPAVRGALAILFNPGGWLFLGAVASPLFAAAARAGGTRSALLVALGLVTGAAVGDCGVVLLGAVGVRRAGERVGRWVGRVLAALLAGLGVWLVVQGVVS